MECELERDPDLEVDLKIWSSDILMAARVGLENWHRPPKIAPIGPGWEWAGPQQGTLDRNSPGYGSTAAAQSSQDIDIIEESFFSSTPKC